MNVRDLVFYDGTCGLCHGAVKFLVKHDKQRVLRYAALQSDFAAEKLKPHGQTPDDLDTIYVIADMDTEQERVLDRGRAAVHLARRLPAPWSWMGLSVAWLPTALLDFGYRLVAERRYKIFGRADACSIPTPEERALFLDIS